MGMQPDNQPSAPSECLTVTDVGMFASLSIKVLAPDEMRAYVFVLCMVSLMGR